MRTPSRPIPENAEGYLARAKAVHKLAMKPPHMATGDRKSLGEFLHSADVEGA